MPESNAHPKSADLVLVHGAWHGAWCWRELSPLLQLLGHRVHCFDLPGLGHDRTPLHEVTLDAYTNRTVAAVRSLDGPAWLLGHSMGGGVVSQSAEYVHDKLLGIIYLAARLPMDGHSISEEGEGASALARHLEMDELNERIRIAPEHARSHFYNMCDNQLADWAQRQLSPWQPLLPLKTPLSLTRQKTESIPLHYIECLHDNSLPVEAQRVAQSNATFASVVSLNSDHSPFLSCPQSLADAIDRIVHREANDVREDSG